MIFSIPCCLSISFADLRSILVEAACGTTAFKCDCFNQTCFEHVDTKG
jgi:hypothetical protein